jgi:DNA-binding NarL/FixJ family response regulator
MPGMSGIAFHEVLAERWPHLAPAVVFITGGVFSPEVEEAMRGGANPVMRKPLDPGELLDTVSSVVARRVCVARSRG